jgi:uncharacterized protein (DUF1800 family)
MRSISSILSFLVLILGVLPSVNAQGTLDADGDGMSDVWEAAYGGTSLTAGGDSDGDGKTNREEAHAGTNPFDPASRLAIKEVKMTNAGTAQLRWQSVAGKDYHVEASSDFKNWSKLGGTIAGAGAELTATIPLSSALPNGKALVSRWQNMPHLAPIEMVRSNITDNVQPTDTFDISIVETLQTGPTGSLPNMDNYGQWIRGWVIPPATGNYTFWVSADEQAQLWISSSAAAADKTLVAFNTALSAWRDWLKYPTQQSAPIAMVANQPYYFEVLHKEFWGEDHAEVAWAGPGVPMQMLSASALRSNGQTLRDQSRKGGVAFRVVVSDKDTDNDGVSDADEILIGFNPNSPTTVPRIQDRDSIRRIITATNTVTVGAAVPRAYESGQQPGRFTIYRTGNINSLTVQYAVSGTATPGTDYAPLTGTAYLGIGQNSVEVVLTPLIDALTEPAETVTLTIQPSSAFSVGSLSQATVTIDDAPDQLFVATLRPGTGTISNAYGSAALNLAGNDVFTTFSLRFGNLTTQQARSEFYISTNGGSSGSAVRSLPTGQLAAQRWNLEPTAGYTTAQIVTALKNGQLYARVISSRFPDGEIFGRFVREAGWQTMPTPPAPPPVSLNSPSEADAARFLTQATFGPTGSDISRFLSLGYNGWLEEQRTLAATQHLPYVQARRAELVGRGGGDGFHTPRQEAWWQNAIAAPDQLRQRMALALSEIFVVSDISPLITAHEGLSKYYDQLLNGGFGNYRDLLKTVTLSPMMGQYLSMARNKKPNPETGQEPDENYAREVMQLFSMGLHQLHQDGSVKLGANALPIPSYTQADIAGLARVFTGWGYFYPGTPPAGWFQYGFRNDMNPMMQYPEFHDTGAKTIVNGVNIPAGLTGEQELELALDAIFNHPNVGPMIAGLLIQRFVTSNPSPGYIYRVAAAFNNNGAGVRGDLWATLKAILLDYEARSPQPVTDIGYGKQREPLLRFTHMYRALKAQPPRAGDPRFFLDLRGIIPQAALQSPSVFNFFDPNYSQAGRISAAGLYSPEFQLTSESNVVNQINLHFSAIFWGTWTLETNAQNQNFYVHLDHTEELALLNRAGFTPQQNEQALIDLLNVRLLAGQMSAGLRQRLTQFFALCRGTTTTGPSTRTSVSKSLRG